MVWRVITPEQIVDLPFHRSIHARLMKVSYQHGSYTFTWASSVPLTTELAEILQEEVHAAIRQLNGLLPDAPLYSPEGRLEKE